MRIQLLAVLAVVVPVVGSAQTPSLPSTVGGAVSPQATNPLTTYTRTLHYGMRGVILQAAESMPAERYTFRPTEDVRTFGQVLGHIADSQYVFCSAATGATTPTPRIEETLATKPELIAGLRAAFAYCDGAYERLTDANASEMRSFRGAPLPTVNVLSTNEVHTTLHYGNLVTYLRINGIIPPTSDSVFLEQRRGAIRRQP